jgi:predicted Zn finger-like uncharacterized protein
MIAACPRCSTRFRIGAERLRDEGVRLRCSQCQAVFRVYPPHADAPRRRDDPVVDAELTPPPRPLERERMVLIADPDAARGKASAAELSRLGLLPLLVHDGVEALLMLQRNLPGRVLIDVDTPRLSGPELCEVVKRNESLTSIRVVITGTVESLVSVGPLRAAGLGPDATLERADLPEGLAEALRLGSPTGTVADSPPSPSIDQKPEPEVQQQPAERLEPVVHPATAKPEPASPPAVRPPVAPTPVSVDVDPELARAERLARIVVSDIILYNTERFERAAKEGDVLEALANELEEGRALFRQRVPASLCVTRDFLGDEIQRVARARAQRSAEAPSAAR